MVYVDELFDCRAFNPPSCFKGWSCHMWADSLEELLAMAERIRMKREWLQNNRNGDFPHFYLTRRRRRAARLCGAVQKSLKDHLRMLRGNA